VSRRKVLPIFSAGWLTSIKSASDSGKTQNTNGCNTTIVMNDTSCVRYSANAWQAVGKNLMSFAAKKMFTPQTFNTVNTA